MAEEFLDGYVTITADYRFLVSSKLKGDSDKGGPNYPFDRRRMWVPALADLQPSRTFLECHESEVFRA